MRRLLVVALAITAFVVPVQAARAAPAPILELTSVAVTRIAGGYGAEVAMHTRLCVSLGPAAAITTRQTRRTGAVTNAQQTLTEPLLAHLDRVYPYQCVRDYVISWLVPRRLLNGSGTYTATIRVRDGYGRWTRPIAVAVAAGAA